MSRLVTGLFYDRLEAQSAVESLRAAGIAADDIYLEREVEPTSEMGRKGGEVMSAEKERRIAGLETGLIIGLAIGMLAGIFTGVLGSGVAETMFTDSSARMDLVRPIANPVVTGLVGAIIGLMVGGAIGWMVDHTLDRMGAGPPLPAEETLVTVRCDDGNLEQVYASLFNARARHLHVADRALA